MTEGWKFALGLLVFSVLTGMIGVAVDVLWSRLRLRDQRQLLRGFDVIPLRKR